MRLVFAVLAVEALFAFEAGAQNQVFEIKEADEEDVAMPPAPQTPEEVLRGTLSRLPVEPIRLRGSLISRKRRGIVVKEVLFEMEFSWGGEPKKASYILLDTFGRTLCHLVVTLSPNGEVSARRFGPDGAESPAPPLLEQVEGTDITWLDITLSYLWWKDAQITGEDEFRGALCDIVTVRPPQPMEGCSFVRLWVDRKRAFLRQVEQFDESGACVRSMWVSSVGKIGDRWMIRNMEVKRAGTGVMTKLHVDSLDSPGDSPTTTRQGGAGQ